MAVDPSMPILVVDDYNTMIRIIRNLLRQLGFEDVDDASDGSIALSKMQIKRYGLMISDWNMEPMTGYELLKQVRSDPEPQRDAVHHGHRRIKTENVIAAKQAGVNNYIVKPFNAETLKSKIDAVFLSALSRRQGRSPRQSPRDRLRRNASVGKNPVQRRQIGSCRSPNSSAWMPAVTNRQSMPKSVAPVRSVRTEFADGQHPLSSPAAAAQRGHSSRARS